MHEIGMWRGEGDDLDWLAAEDDKLLCALHEEAHELCDEDLLEIVGLLHLSCAA